MKGVGWKGVGRKGVGWKGVGWKGVGWKNPCKKVIGKNVSGKINLEIKTLVKKSQFSEVLEQNVTGNEVMSFRFLGLFFLK